MKQEKTGVIETIKTFFSPEKWDKTFSKLVKNDGTFDDGHPLKSELIVFREFPQQNGQVSIRPIGNSTYLLLNDVEKGILSNTENPIKKTGYNDINNNLILMLDCGPRKGGET